MFSGPGYDPYANLEERLGERKGSKELEEERCRGRRGYSKHRVGKGKNGLRGRKVISNLCFYIVSKIALITILNGKKIRFDIHFFSEQLHTLSLSLFLSTALQIIFRCNARDYHTVKVTRLSEETPSEEECFLLGRCE